jgi:hypothetical protein
MLGLNVGRILLSLHILLLTWTDGQCEDNRRTAAPDGIASLAVTRADIDGTHLRLDYTITNGLAHEVWLCDTMDEDGCDFEALWGEEGRTFIVRKRTDIAWDVARDMPLARYVRLRAGGILTETMILPLPLRAQGVVSRVRVPSDAEYVARIVLEIGCYDGDLPATIRNNLETREADREREKHEATRVPAILGLNAINEHRGNAEGEILFYVDRIYPVSRGERILRASVGSQRIGRTEGNDDRRSPPNLRDCNRLEVTYEPSALAYFFPHDEQRRLFTPTEREYLASPHTTTVNDWREVKEFIYQIGQAWSRGITAGRAAARVVCYQNHDRLVAMEMYDNCFLTEAGEPFALLGPYDDGYDQKFRGLASWVGPFEIRVACARNLRDLWNRLRLYAKAKTSRVPYLLQATQVEYPAAIEWCDSIFTVYKNAGMLDEHVARPFRCPSPGEGKCHYAMNPECKANSPADTVLLFETSAGWNQHGGPELFTFDNHDPKGGLVLLNDGTVKFIRTEEELKHLRWK